MRHVSPQSFPMLGAFWTPAATTHRSCNGGGAIRGIYLRGNQAVAPIFGAWVDALRDLGATHVSIRNTGGTDHQSFNSVGLPGFQFIRDPLEYSTFTHHSNMDTFERLQPDDISPPVGSAALRSRKTRRDDTGAGYSYEAILEKATVK